MKQEVEVEPLTRVTSSGILLRRRPEVDDQIREVLLLDPDTLKARINVRDHGVPTYIRMEAIVYLVRHFLSAGNLDAVDVLSAAMIARLTPAINRRIRVIAANLRDDCFAEAVSNIFKRVIDVSSDKDDYAQVTFWTWFDNRVMDAVGKHFKLQEHEVVTNSLTREEQDDGGDEDVPHDPEFRPGDITRVEHELLIGEALGLLTENERTAFLMRYYWGWKTDSQEPDEPTISKHFGKSEKTVRNWLRSAEEKIAKWRDHRGT